MQRMAKAKMWLMFANHIQKIKFWDCPYSHLNVVFIPFPNQALQLSSFKCHVVLFLKIKCRVCPHFQSNVEIDPLLLNSDVISSGENDVCLNGDYDVSLNGENDKGFEWGQWQGVWVGQGQICVRQVWVSLSGNVDNEFEWGQCSWFEYEQWQIWEGSMMRSSIEIVFFFNQVLFVLFLNQALYLSSFSI